MELVAGYPFWLIKDGLPFSYKKLSENISTPVLIMGGGISGAITAYYLIEAGIECVLVDGRTIGLGSTCASTSLLQYELDTPLHKLIEKVGEYTAVRSYQWCGRSIQDLERIAKHIGYGEFERSQSVFFSTHRADKSFLQKELKARERAGFQLEWLDSSSLNQEYGIRGQYAIRSETGGTIDAYAFTHALLQHAIGKGLQVYDRTKISKLKYSTAGVDVITEDDHRIHAERMINATGFEVVNFISKNIVDLYCTYASVSEQIEKSEAGWKDRAVLWTTDDPYMYMRITTDNRIIIGGRDERFSNKASRHLYSLKSALLVKDFKKIFPALDFKTEFAWSGTFGKTKDSLPYIGEYKKTPGTYYALGFGGNGITFSVIAAQIIRDALLGKKNEDAGLFSFERKKG